MFKKLTVAFLLLLASISGAQAQLTKVDNPIRRSSSNVYPKSALYNLGVGTTSPNSNYILDANGNIRILGMDGITGPWGTYIDWVNGGADTIRVGGDSDITYFEVRNTNNESVFLYHDGTNGVIESTLGFTKINDVLILSTASKTISSDGTGAPASSTLTISTSTGRTVNPVTCNDKDGCLLTLSETNATSGMKVVIINVGSNPVTMSDSSGVQTLKGDWVGAQYDSIEFQYQSSQWLEVGRSSRYDWIGDTNGLFPRLTSYNVGIGTFTPTAKFTVAPPATQVISSGGTITADACGTIKKISSVGAVTTDTTNTFTAPASTQAGCIMTVRNVDSADTITLDQNANFSTIDGNNIALPPNGRQVQVSSDGTTWSQVAPIVDTGAGGAAIASDSIWDAKGDMVVATGADTAAKVSVGTNGYVLTADSAQTAGVKWAAASLGMNWVLEPERAKLPTSNAMEISAVNNRWRGLYDGTTDECAEWMTHLRPYSSGTMNIKLDYSVVSSISSKVVAFDVYVMCVSDGDSQDIDVDSFGSTNNITSGTISLTAGDMDTITAALSNGDSCAQDDLIIVKICRDADGNDTVGATDVEFRGAAIYE